MKKFLIAAMMAVVAFAHADAQQPSEQGDVFVPIAKYMQAGQYENLSAWFADNLELSVMDQTSNCSRNQAKLIMKQFFADYSPKSFTVVHKGGNTPMRFAVGNLVAGADKFRVIIYVRIADNGKSSIQQLRIDKQ